MNTFDRNKDEDKRKNTIEFDYLTRDKEQIIAMSVIGAKIVQFDVPFEEAKRESTELKLWPRSYWRHLWPLKKMGRSL